ncbi:NLPA lipoprotein [Thalassobacillus devorans]|uniref:NLPA lipoprotein n=1 Tax=Thalassobacillus devorans TaxID=279813 RepID=A0ABQ1PL69_9BACI|nr:ABC transporter substrate-binding protein [Thalassobacillus devorans]NIK30193.1 NitT/TauT family transport system substrate-binding protein [Thalassobacillus devorans]GGC99094.1 NLPA lipoprotein [Thalassobacillus devorans]
MFAKKMLWIASFSVLLLVMSACGSDSETDGDGKPTIKLGYLPITHAVPLYMEKHLIEEQDKNFNIELVKFPSWPDLMDALNTGQIDGASALVTVAMKAKEQGIDLKAVALGHRDGNVLVTDNEIESVQDLKGETFAIPHKFSTHNILLYQMLKKEGLAYEDVNAVEMPPAEMPAALSEGRIAGYVVAEPFGAQSVALGKGKVLYQSDELWTDSVDCALILHNDFIEKDKELVQEFMNSYVEAGKEAEKKDQHVHDVASEYMKVNEEVMDLSLKWISYDDLRIPEDSYQELSSYLQEMGLSENPPSYEEFVDNTFIDKAK